MSPFTVTTDIICKMEAMLLCNGAERVVTRVQFPEEQQLRLNGVVQIVICVNYII